MPTTYAKLGTVSHGTLRPVDLIESFADALDYLCATDSEHEALVWDARRILSSLRHNEHTGRDDNLADKAAETISDLTDALDTYAPPYCYFGATDGDGSDFGFWVNFDSIEWNVSNGDLLKVSDLSEVPDEWNGAVAVVNDHGNMTLYTPTRIWTEAWSVV